MTDEQRLDLLRRTAPLLDQVIDHADRCGEPLLAAQVAHALDTLDAIMARLHAGHAVPDRPPADMRDDFD